jgi:glutamate dehydrogenase
VFLENSRIEVIEQLVDYIAQKLPHEEVPLIKSFVLQYYLNVSPEDLTSRSILDLYGAVVSHWYYIYQRKPGEAKARAFNPRLEKDGWQSTHTIIEISFDDMPFLVDSVSMTVNRLNLDIHLIIHMGNLKLKRDKEGRILQVFDEESSNIEWKSEAVIYIEIDRVNDSEVLLSIANEVKRVLEEVRTVVEDWPKMREKALFVLEELSKTPKITHSLEVTESIEFLRWVINDHFTFLGYQEYKITSEAEKTECQSIVGSQLGVLKFKQENDDFPLSELSVFAQKLIFSKQALTVGKTAIRSTVHRPAYADFIAVKVFDEQSNVLGERLFIGLYTANAYNSSPKQIPLLRYKINNILKKAGFKPKSHADRAILNILETLPRDDLFQASEEDLLELSIGIFHLQERQRVRLFVRKDIYGFFISCFVFVPRDKYTSVLGEKMKEVLLQGFNGIEVEFSTRFSESSLARVHFVVRVDPSRELIYDFKALEKKLVEISRSWQDDFRDALVEYYGEAQGNDLLRRYKNAFPASYRENFSARIAVVDIEYFEKLSKGNPLCMSLYKPLEENEEVIGFKLFRIGATIPLSDVVPILENMGLRIISERPYEIISKTKGLLTEESKIVNIATANLQGVVSGDMRPNDSIWINDYRMVHKNGGVFNTDIIKVIFQEAFDHIWRGEAENDSFNHLVLGAQLTWREIMVLRAYAKYLWQAGFTFSQVHVEETLVANPEISAMLVKLFELRFAPGQNVTEIEQRAHKQKIEKLLESVNNLNEDRILRRYMYVILATVRTNYYRTDLEKKHKPYFSFKLKSSEVPELPLPVPLYEIFVYSPRVEAIHLRAAKVARGGIRWSDRREDFRTEILGLMKTQQVKNAVIVPMGAKGGFVVKRILDQGTREQVMEEVIYCYKTLIYGLLDLTDNYKGTEVINPRDVICYDDNDPYLVVAADKGTATFSDIANSISKEYGFWLNDAFASGGSTGYDHKKMGITARGVWESVKHHFRELGVDPQTQDFTVIGIGDMAGDVFGNGLLLSRRIKLIAAFNHVHIFLDPNPDPKQSFLERMRLFSLPRSTWNDYNPALISKGGGVFFRSAKSIDLSPEIQNALDFYQNAVIPNELIRAILKAPVDLLWNGGIGTYVKAISESNVVVGDRANDALRINGADLRCRVVGEGGNLGFTQLGRVEYAKRGGYLNTDAIDNSGGVNCSDNEVNIKILLDEVVSVDDLTKKQRNEILTKISSDVASLVLNNNCKQTRAISAAIFQAVDNLEMHGRLIRELERSGRLNRALECLPDKEEISTRKLLNQGLTRPEIAVLMAYSKIALKEALLISNLPEDPYFQKELEQAFPVLLQERFKQYMPSHRLKREIIATQVSNAVINEMGINFISRLQDETGSQPPEIVRGYTISREIFGARELYNRIDTLSANVGSQIQYKIWHEVNRLVRRGTRWFLRNRSDEVEIHETIEHFKLGMAEINTILPKFLLTYDLEVEELARNLIAVNVPEDLALKISSMNAMFSSLDIIEAATLNKYPIDQVTEIYYEIGSRLQLGWFRELIKRHKVSNHWEALARAAFRDDLDRQQRNVTISILHSNGQATNDLGVLINKWLSKHNRLVNRWEYFISEFKNLVDPDFTMFAVALRELLDMTYVRIRKQKN